VSKPIKRVDLSKLTPDQRAALAQFAKDAQSVAPQWEDMQRAARTVFEKWLRSPQFHANEGPLSQELPDQSWTGAPEINYVESFDK
jgi:hypothetical protein